MAENLGWDADELAHAKTMRHDSWIYIAQFFGPRAEPLPNPNDSINADPCLPRFQFAYHDFGDKVLVDVVDSGPRWAYYEPQLLGPTALTHFLAP